MYDNMSDCTKTAVYFLSKFNYLSRDRENNRREERERERERETHMSMNF